MISSYHRNLSGKMKIQRKPRPIGVEIKGLADGKTKIILNIEKHEAKEKMQNKDFVNELGATTACSLRLTKPYWGTGRTVIADAWFGSVKCAIQLRNRGLYSIMVVKNNSMYFPNSLLEKILETTQQVDEKKEGSKITKELQGTLQERNLKRGEWVSAVCKMDNNYDLASRLKDLKEKKLICMAGTSSEDTPRITLSGKEVSRPNVGVEYANSSAAVDIYNHVRTGGTGIEDT